MNETAKMDISAAHKAMWFKSLKVWVILLVLMVVSFYETLTGLFLVWWDKPEYNHCLLILPIIGYLLNERKAIFAQISPCPTLWGLVPVFGGAFLWLMGELADADVVRHASMVIFLQGTIVSIFGFQVVRAFLFPFLYLVFLIPFGDFLVPYLQNFTRDFIVVILGIMDIPVYTDGVFLTIPAGKFHVAEACAGLRFLVATVALGTLMANVAYKTRGRQMIVVVLSFLVPVIANGFRATGIVLIAHYSEMKYATGADHLVFGWIFFAFVLLVFIGVAMTFTNRSIHDGYIDPDHPFWKKKFVCGRARFFSLMGFLALMTVGAPLYSQLIEQRYEESASHRMAAVSVKGYEVSEVTGSWRPHFDGATQEIFKNYSLSMGPGVDFYTAYYPYQNNDREMIRYNNGFSGDVWLYAGSAAVHVKVAGQDHQFIEEFLHSGRGNRLVWYVYWVDGHLTSNQYVAKLLEAKAKLMGGRLDSAVIAFSVPVRAGLIDKARLTLRSFARNLPSLENMIQRVGE